MLCFILNVGAVYTSSNPFATTAASACDASASYPASDLFAAYAAACNASTAGTPDPFAAASVDCIASGP